MPHQRRTPPGTTSPLALTTDRHLHVVPDSAEAHVTAPLAVPPPVAVDIARLLRALPPPVDADPRVFRRWLAGKADLFDRIADAAADDSLADDARAVAAAARHALAALALPASQAAALPAPDCGGDAA